MSAETQRRVPRRGYRTHIGLVLAAGVLSWALALPWLPPLATWSEPVLLLLALLVFGGQFRGVVHRGDDGRTDIAFTVPFSFALYLLYGPAVAMAVDALGQLFSDVARRKPIVKLAFNQATTATAFAVVHLVFLASGVAWTLPESPTPVYLFVFTLAAVLSLVVVYGAVSMVIALSQGLPLRHWLDARGMVTKTASSALLVPLALLLAATSRQSIWYLPIAALPVIIAEAVSVDLTRRRFEAIHDPETGLLNRRGLVERLTDDPGAYTLMYVQISGLDELSGSLTPDRVDGLRVQVAKRVSDLLPSEAVVARGSDDGIAVVLPAHVPGDADLLARWLSEPYTIDSWSLAIEITIGVARAPEHGRDPEDVLVRAKAAAYAAVRQEIHATEYCSGIEDEQQARLSLMAEVRRAVQGGELRLWYQPRVCLRTGAPLGMEALVRWEHPERGMVSPDSFIPAIEQTLLIDDVTRWVLEQALDQLRRWRRSGHEELRMAVNIASHNLLDEHFVEDVAALLERYGLPPGILELELTERSVAADVARTRRTLEQLDELGVRLSLDDFGTGYSSMAQLRSLPVHMVKIDRSFVMPLRAGSDDSVLVQAMVGLASSLGLEIVAEGVENDEGRRILIDLACESAQGYFFSKPLPEDSATAWLRDCRERDAARRETPGVRRDGGHAHATLG